MAGYSVYVQRDDGAFKHETDVSISSVTLRGEPGSSARVTVVAFDSSRAYGPSSPTSPLFTFPDVGSSTGASAPTTGSSSEAAATGGQASFSVAGADAATSTSSNQGEPSPAALPGTLVWQAGDGFRLTDTELVTTRLFARPQEGAQLAGVADFDADGQGDLLWVGANAQLGFTSGSTLRASSDPVALVDLGALGADERVIGAGDFDGDGDGDVLVASGDAVRVRLGAVGSAPAVNELGTASNAVVAGIADFDANGSDDIVWRSSTGALVVWLLNGGNLAATVEVGIPNAYVPIGAGDFDGNGSAEIAVRYENGTVYLVHPLADVSELQSTDLGDASSWTPVGDADLDGDGSDELVLSTAGAVGIASLPGNQILSLEPQSPWQLVALLP